ncbi:MAG TPA: fructosamine kinase family protein [Flavobacteriaceae bacterium]|nr:fructosamine kinase family protein [Flavobacteriaceae bacterium]
MIHDLKKHLSNILNENITKVSSVRGGDISKAYKIETSENSYFLKINKNLDAFEMFQTEAAGLELIRNTNTIKAPKVLACDTFESSAFLLMEFIESKSPSNLDFENLGLQLADLHKNTRNLFGLNHNNFIGNLTQSNSLQNTWVDFYTQERLLPQLKLVKQKHLLSDKECPTENEIKQSLNSLFVNINPSLLHGDLWSGDYIISKNGIPYLIDPAVYYGHNEVDIAMTKLFGGFDDTFYNAYFSNFKPNELTSTRIEIYQLYYLLVHLNLFGKSYRSSVVSILKKYF